MRCKGIAGNACASKDAWACVCVSFLKQTILDCLPQQFPEVVSRVSSHTDTHERSHVLSEAIPVRSANSFGESPTGLAPPEPLAVKPLGLDLQRIEGSAGIARVKSSQGYLFSLHNHVSPTSNLTARGEGHILTGAGWVRLRYE